MFKSLSASCRFTSSLKTRLAVSSQSLSTTSRLRQDSDNMALTLFDDLGILVKGANLAVGSPGPKELAACNEMFSKATAWRLSQDDSSSLFAYGPRSGHPGYLSQLAKFLSKHYDDEVKFEDLVGTAGASHGLGLLTHYYFSEGDIVFVEDTSYFLALTFFRNDCGLKIVSVPTDKDGILVDKLQALIHLHGDGLKEKTSAKPFRAMLYVVSTYHNPTGRSMKLERSTELIRTAQANDLLVVSDDVYNLLPFSQGLQDGDFAPITECNDKLVAPQRLYHFERKLNEGKPGVGNVVSNGTFSKILAPGARLGWLEGSRTVLDPIRSCALIQSSGAVQQLLGGLAEGVLALGLQDEHLAKSRLIYENRARALCRSLQQHLPKEVVWSPPAGGYFMWLELPEKIDGVELKAAALKENISIAAGVGCSPEGKFKNCIRISFTYEDESVLEHGGKVLGRLIKEMM